MAEIEQTPAVAPAAGTEPAAPIVVETPVAPLEQAVAAPVETAVPNAHETPTLLEEVPAPGAEKPAEAAPVEAKSEGDKPVEKPAVEAKPETKPEQAPEVKPEAPAEPVKYEFKFPETIKPDAKAIESLSGVFNEGKLAPEVAQKIIDIGSKTLTDYAQNLQREQMKVFADTRANWRKEVMASEDLGGAGHQTAMGAVARMRDLLASDHRPGTQEYESDMKSLNDFMRYTGAGDNPVFLRLLHRAARYFDEPALPPPGGNPPPSNGQRPGRRGLQDIYRETRESQGR